MSTRKLSTTSGADQEDHARPAKKPRVSTEGDAGSTGEEEEDVPTIPQEKIIDTLKSDDRDTVATAVHNALKLAHGGDIKRFELRTSGLVSALCTVFQGPHGDDIAIVVRILTTLRLFLSDNDPKDIEAVVSSGCVPKLMSLLADVGEEDEVLPREGLTVVSFLTSEGERKEVIKTGLKHGLLTSCVTLLKSKHDIVKEAAAGIVGNFATCDDNTIIDQLFSTPGCIESLFVVASQGTQASFSALWSLARVEVAGRSGDGDKGASAEDILQGRVVKHMESKIKEDTDNVMLKIHLARFLWKQHDSVPPVVQHARALLHSACDAEPMNIDVISSYAEFIDDVVVSQENDDDDDDDDNDDNEDGSGYSPETQKEVDDVTRRMKTVVDQDTSNHKAKAIYAAYLYEHAPGQDGRRQALSLFQQALSPEHDASSFITSELLFVYVHCCLKCQELDSAHQVLERGLHLDPEDSGLMYLKACWYALKGEEEQAVSTVTDALSIGFDDIDTLADDPFLDSVRNNRTFKRLMLSLKSAGGSSSDEDGDP